MFWFWIFLMVFTVQMCFAYAYRFRAERIKVHAAQEYPPVSILVCAKNEAQNLMAHLPQLLHQQYPNPNWELVVVNDASTDDTAELLLRFAIEYPQLRVVHIDVEEQRNFPGKKYALQQGLAACRHEVVLLTDADCTPTTEHWMSRMTDAYLTRRAEYGAPGIFVLGYGAYSADNSLLQWFVAWETLHTFMQYTSWAKMGLPYMGVGRNLMYEKTPVLQLMQHQDFALQFSSTASGDDDLIVSALANAANTIVCMDAEAHTMSLPPDNWQRWWRQKSRHLSSGKYYAGPVKFGLALYALSSFLFWPLAIILLIFSQSLLQSIVLFLLILRLLAFWANGLRWARGLGNTKKMLLYPLGEWMWLIYNLILSPYIFWKNKQQWK